MSQTQTKTVKSEAEKSKKIEVAIPQKDISQVLKTLSILVEEATFSFTNEGVHVRCMDASHVGLLDIALPNANFEKYEVENDVQVAVRLDDSIKMINLFEPISMVRISYDDDYPNILNFHTRSESYKIRTIEVNKAESPLPKIPYDSNIKFDCHEITEADFVKQLRKIETISDYVTFETSQNWFNLSGKGDAGDVLITNERGQVSIKKRDDNSKSTYSLEYLLPFLKTLQKDRTIEIDYSTAKPLRIRAHLDGSAFMDFYLAPRVED